MRRENPTQNKLITLARRVWDLTEDNDFAFRKLAKCMKISVGTANEVHKIWKGKYLKDIEIKLKEKKKVIHS